MSYHVICHFAGIFDVMLVGGPAEGCLHPEGSYPFFQRDVDVAEPCQLPGVEPQTIQYEKAESLHHPT